MRTIPVLLAAVLALFSGTSMAREFVILDFIGYGWETAGFPPSETGDVLEIPVVVDNLSAALGVDLEAEELTGRMSGLVSQSSEEISPGLFRIIYSGGELTFHRDPGRDHDFGTHPPNATSPATFVNGTLCLRGTLENFTFYFHEPTGAGTMEATVTFTDGDCMEALSALDPTGFTFGGFLTRQSGGSVVEGYDMQLDGFLEANASDNGECSFDCLNVVKARFELEDDDDDDGDDDGDREHGDHDDKPGVGNAADADALLSEKECDKHSSCLDTEFKIEGVFTPCAGAGEIDPEQLELTVHIGDYMQTIPVGSLRPEDEDDDDHDRHDKGGIAGAGDEDGDHDRDKDRDNRENHRDRDGDHHWRHSHDREHDKDDERSWEYDKEHACGEIESITLEQEDKGVWSFELSGEGIATALTLPDGKELHLELTLGALTGTTQVTLVAEDDECVYDSGDTPVCGDSTDPQDDDDQLVLDQRRHLLTRGAHLQASPNPFGKSTTLLLQVPESVDATVQIYDLRGRVVRTLYSGPVQPDEQWAWDGNDSRGIPVASGIYFYRVTTAGTSNVHKLVRMK